MRLPAHVGHKGKGQSRGLQEIGSGSVEPFGAEDPSYAHPTQFDAFRLRIREPKHLHFGSSVLTRAAVNADVLTSLL